MNRQRLRCHGKYPLPERNLAERDPILQWLPVQGDAVFF